MSSKRLLSEEEVASALHDLRYRPYRKTNGWVIYRHVEEPGVRVVLDFSRGPIPFEQVMGFLSDQGVNLDAFSAYLED